MPTDVMNLTVLKEALTGGAAAIRARTRLQPAGGPGDKVFPPTFGDTVKFDGHVTRYAVEHRRVGGTDVACVLLDSVSSQANRMEESLQRAWDDGRLAFPIVRVDFTKETHEDPALDLSTLGGDGYLTSLEVPHRLADALFRDSMLGGLRFRASEPGRAFTEAGPHHATPLYRLSPTTLVFGVWDSTGPRGGQGAKFQRALVSEIVGIGMTFGRKTSSRLDPAGIELNAGPVFKAQDADEDWTLDKAAAAPDEKKKGPQHYSKGKQDKPGRPSLINHGNITPTIDGEAGGVTMDYAEQTTVLSIPALRRLRFPKDVAGRALAQADRVRAEAAARTALAALAIAAVSLQRDEGYDLRSRCALVPEGPLRFEVVDRDGRVSGPYELSSDGAVALVAQAAAEAAREGMGWTTETIDLTPAPKLVALIRKSREVAATAEGEEAS